MNVVQRLIPEKFKDTRPGLKLVPKFITIHETDNTGLKANAEAHARLQENGNTRQASWHVQVDDTQAIQSIPFDEVAWAAGDGANGPGNRTSIHIEICVNKDGNYQKAVQNAAEVTRQLMSQFNISLTNVVQHNHWSGKNCPSIMRSGTAGITWNDFINLCNGFKPMEVDDMLEKAIVVNGFADFGTAEPLANRLQAPIYTRASLGNRKVSKELYVVGGTTDGLQADKIVPLTGADRYEVAAAVKKFLG
jgi:hypothetical protein